ncbi:3-hydroxyacyl-CoA dehydrogenase [bacterium]|nr:3-hydroxyacyl-CoA dehydrogenase [candidate division CSSED10-310 bacterium]
MAYIFKAAVVGAGTMGGSIAQTITFSGLPVVLKDIDEKAVEIGLDKVRDIYQKRVSKGKMTEGEMQMKMNLVTGTTTYEDFEDVDIVIEAVPEDMAIKKKVLAELDEVLGEEAIIASNTSALSITEMAAATKRSGKVVGMHFFNPAHVMKLVEVIPGLTTDEETVESVIEFSESLRKIPVRVNECAGFLVNRLLSPYLNEAVMCVQEGAATPEQIDEAMVEFGWPMGPFVLADMLGLDVCAKVSKIMYHAFGPRMSPPLLVDKLVAMGRLGQKNGKGFFDYQEDKGSEGLAEVIAETQKESGCATGTVFSPERLNYALINEAVVCLQENVSSAGDIDIAMMAGTGFPQDLGGPLKYADSVGVNVILEKLEAFSRELGPRFWPAPMLKRMVAAGFTGIEAGQGFYHHG